MHHISTKPLPPLFIDVACPGYEIFSEVQLSKFSAKVAQDFLLAFQDINSRKLSVKGLTSLYGASATEKMIPIGYEGYFFQWTNVPVGGSLRSILFMIHAKSGDLIPFEM